MNRLNSINNINELTCNELNELYNNLTNKNIEASHLYENPMEIMVCSHCHKNDSIIEDKINGTIVCQECGNVICSSMIDHGPEWYKHDDKGDNSRCGIPINVLLPQSSLGTTIGGYCHNRIKTLHTWNAMPYKERSLNTVLNIIKDKCQKSGILGCIEQDAKILYKTVSECKHFNGKNEGKHMIIRGNNRKALIAACVLFACRKIGKSRSIKEIAELFNIKSTVLSKGCKLLSRLIKHTKFDYNSGSSLPEHFILRFCEEMKINKNYTNVAIKISKNIQRLNIASSHTPSSIATGSILLLSHMYHLKNLTKKKIAKKLNTSEVTVTKTYNKIEIYKNILIDDNKVDKVIKKMEESIQNEDIPEFLKRKLYKITYKKLDLLSTFNVETEKKYIDIERKIDTTLNRIIYNKVN